MVGLTDSAYRALAQVPDPDDAADLAEVRTASVAALGESRYAQEYASGAALGAEEAFGLTWAG